MNILNKLPKSLQAKAKSDLQQIWMAATRTQALMAVDGFVKTYAPKYPKAAECLTKDREALLALYDFPSEHWHHLRTTNPIESTFASAALSTSATVRLRTAARLCLAWQHPVDGVQSRQECGEPLVEAARQ